MVFEKLVLDTLGDVVSCDTLGDVVRWRTNKRLYEHLFEWLMRKFCAVEIHIMRFATQNFIITISVYIDYSINTNIIQQKSDISTPQKNLMLY